MKYTLAIIALLGLTENTNAVMISKHHGHKHHKHHRNENVQVSEEKDENEEKDGDKEGAAPAKKEDK